MASDKTKRPLTSRADLEELIQVLYSHLMVDPEIGHFFTEVVVLDLEKHIPRIVDFWEMVLLQTGEYQGDPMDVHVRLNRLMPLKGSDFEVWLRHFDETVDATFEGEMAERAKQRAHSIATLMQVKLSRENKN